jgi:AcrR family transcriptional regulator
MGSGEVTATSGETDKQQTGLGSRRLPRVERRRQLLDVALLIVRNEGADRLTLGHLAACAGVSKPVVYDHFETRSDLLITLYRWIDTEKVNAFRDAMATVERRADETVDLLASAYIDCAADLDGEFHAVGAALAGSAEKSAVFTELLENSVAMFVAVLTPHTSLMQDELNRRCVGLVGAGEALAAAKIRGVLSTEQAIASLGALIRGAIA